MIVLPGKHERYSKANASNKGDQRRPLGKLHVLERPDRQASEFSSHQAFQRDLI